MSKEDILANLPRRCDKDWADWVISLYHEKPANVREAVELIVCEAITFGGDMGPDGNIWEGVDNGIFNSNSLIDEWVELVHAAFQKSTQASDEICSIADLDTGNVADYECHEHIKHCKNCNHEFGYVLYNEDGDVWMDEQPCYCPRCGVKAGEHENG